jgi:two-component system, NtrC family, sensor kinase
MKNKLSLPLFWKFTIAIVFVVAIFGSVNLFFINSSLQDLSNKEINSDGISTANVIAERSIDPILYDDISYLDKMVSENLKADSRIAYVIIIDKSGDVLAHTFENIVPIKLLTLNNYDNANFNKIVRIKDVKNPDKIIRNMSVPILDGNLGYVGIGVYEENFLNSIKSINRFFLSMVALFLFFGILGALVFSYIITFPIKKISQMSENLNLDSLETSDNEEEFSIMDNSVLKFKKDFRVTDEIDVLTNRFNEMLLRLKKTYAELQSAQESLMQSEKIAALGILSAGIAHEINNPIAGIQNCLKRISEKPENIKQNIRYIELMEEAIYKIKTVVQGLLNFSRKHELVFSEVNIAQVIENTLLLIAYQLEKSRIAIVKNYPKHIPIIKGSFNHLEQVFLNLLINAIDAIDEEKLENLDNNGEIDITIKTNNNFLCIEIKDNGVGISKDKLKQIFDPFYTFKKIKQGTGLGLAVSFNILEEHNGKITAVNNAKQGMLFKIFLPLSN